MSSDQVAFVDTETTGLDADRHEIWEVGLIVDEQEYLWHLPVDLGRADPIALKIGGFHGRYGPGKGEHLRGARVTPLPQFATEFAGMTRGRHLVGAIVSFDEERLRKLLRANGACPEWHYHIMDVEALAVGWLAANSSWRTEEGALPVVLPWNSDDLSRSVGVAPEMFDKHTAMGDARWAKAIFERVMGTEQ